MAGHVVRWLGLAAIFFVVGGESVNNETLCVWERVQLQSQQQDPVKFNGTIVGWQYMTQSYWGWYVDTEENLVVVKLQPRNYVTGFTMPSSDAESQMKSALANNDITVNVLHCTGDDSRLGDQAVDLRWLPFTSELNLQQCVGLEYESRTLYVARSVCSDNHIGNFVFRPYNGVAIGLCFDSIVFSTKFELLCRVSVPKLVR